MREQSENEMKIEYEHVARARVRVRGATCLALLCAAGVAHVGNGKAPAPPPPAPPAPPTEASTPWSEGVPADKQGAANQLFAEGNALFEQQQLKPALEKYKAALAVWDHPKIRFNLVVTLIRLDQPLEAAENLDKALRYGDKPFAPDLYQQALDYQRLLAHQVGTLEVSCDGHQGAQVSLDGKPWFQCPGTQQLRTTAGLHALVAEQAGYLTDTRRLVIGGGVTTKEAVKLESLESAVKLEYKYPRWVPWTIAGIGVGITAGGLLYWLSGRSQMNSFETDYANECVQGCETDLSQHSPLKQERDSAELKGSVGIGMMIGGGAVIIGGVVGAILNRPHRVMPAVEVQPTAGGAMTSVSLRF